MTWSSIKLTILIFSHLKDHGCLESRVEGELMVVGCWTKGRTSKTTFRFASFRALRACKRIESNEWADARNEGQLNLGPGFIRVESHTRMNEVNGDRTNTMHQKVSSNRRRKFTSDLRIERDRHNRAWSQWASFLPHQRNEWGKSERERERWIKKSKNETE